MEEAPLPLLCRESRSLPPVRSRLHSFTRVSTSTAVQDETSTSLPLLSRASSYSPPRQQQNCLPAAAATLTTALERTHSFAQPRRSTRHLSRAISSEIESLEARHGEMEAAVASLGQCRKHEATAALETSKAEAERVERRWYNMRGSGVDVNSGLTTSAPLKALEVHELRMFFDKLDRDGSGTVSRFELADPLLAAGLVSSLEECERIVRSVDKDGSGEVDWEEFLAIFKPRFDRQRRRMHVAGEDGSGSASVAGSGGGQAGSGSAGAPQRLLPVASVRKLFELQKRESGDALGAGVLDQQRRRLLMDKVVFEPENRQKQLDELVAGHELAYRRRDTAQAERLRAKMAQLERSNSSINPSPLVESVGAVLERTVSMPASADLWDGLPGSLDTTTT